MAETPDQEIQNSGSEEQHSTNKKSRRSPVWILTVLVLAVCATFFVWHVYADRFVPYTDQARVQGIVIPIVPRVSGYITDINVRLHSIVDYDSLMFVLDKRPYELAVKSAEANIDIATQKMGARDATVRSAAARLGVAKAQLDRSQRNYDRTAQVMKENPGALSLADVDRAETALAQAVERVSSAEADLEKAQQELGTIGPENPELRSAIVALEQSELDLYFTEVRAPARGAIESFSIDEGYYSQAGQPIASFVSSEDVWLQADLRENNISNLEIGDSVEFTLDIAPGEIYTGTVRSIGYGVSAGTPSNRGDLPSVSSSKGWLREPQRFPVIIDMDDVRAMSLLRIGAQADVVFYTEHDHPILDKIGHWQIEINSWLSYVR